MRTPNRSFPEFSTRETTKKNHIAEAFPFYIKEFGYTSEYKLIFGQKPAYNDYLLLYSIDGTARFTKSQTTHYVQQNTIVMTACNTPLVFTRVSKEWHFYYFIISGSHAKYFYNQIRTKNSMIIDNPFTGILDGFMDIFVLLTEKQHSYDDTWKYMNISLQLHRIFMSLYDLNANVNAIKKMTPAQETHVNLAVRYIQKHYKEPIDVDSVCAEIGFSKYYFCKIFKKQQGQTIHQYLTDYRIKNAKELLAYSKLSVNTIATQVGFKNSLTFIRAFERTVNMTPSEYRSYYQ